MDSQSHTSSARPALGAAITETDAETDAGNGVNTSTNASAESSQSGTPVSGDRGRRGISLMGIRGGSKRTPSTSTTDLHDTPTGRRAVAGNGGLGLRAPSVHTAENASVYSGRSVAESISGDSKPPSQKSSGMGFVRRLRRLSTAAISSKVNRLFSRSGNPSQDSLLMSGPSSPTSAYMSPGIMPRSPTMPAGSESADGYRTKHMPSYAMGESLSAQTGSFHSSEWRTANAPALPPLPPKPLNARRNRAMTEISPLVVVRGHLNADEADPPEGSGDSITNKLAQTRAKAINSPLVASPLSRKSFHTLNMRTSCDEDMEAEESRAQNMAKSASDNLLAHSETAAPRLPPSFGRGASPKLSRSSSSTTTDTYRQPTLLHRLSYQKLNNLVGTIDSDEAHQATDTPSPPERRGGRSQAYFSSDSRTPTIQRRRTALATLNWLERSDDNESGSIQERDHRLSSTLLLSSGPTGENSSISMSSNGGDGSAPRRQASGNSGGADTPSSILAAFQLRARVGTGLLRKPSTGTSARSSTSITSDSVQSWASAVTGGDMELDDDNDTAIPHSQDSMLMIAASGRNKRDSATPASGARSSAYPPPPAFDKSIADWQQHSQDDTPTLYRHLQYLSGSRNSKPSSTNPFDTPARKPSRDSMLQMRAKEPVLLGSNAEHAADAGLDPDGHDDAASEKEAGADTAEDVDISGQATPQKHASTTVGDEPSSANSTVSNASGALSVLGYPSSQPIRTRGGSQTVHLARAATTNAIRLKGKGAAATGESASSGGIGIALSPSNVVTDRRTAHGSAPEPSNIDLAVERGVLRPRVRATSASNQQFGPNSDNITGTYDGSSYGSGNGVGLPQSNALGRSSGVGTLASIPVSRPPSSMSAYTMSPVSSTMGDETSQIPILSHGHLPSAHMWPYSLGYKSSPDRSSVSDAQMTLTMHSAGAHTPTSTSSPPAHHYIHGHGPSHHHHHSSTGSISGSGQSSHQLRLNMSSVQRSASGHSVSSGISELLEPSSVSQVRKDALWQILVVSKSRADTEIDKMMRHWKETESGMIVCTQDADAKPAVGDEDAIILKVKRGHRRSTSDIKRSDGDRNEFRRRVVELAHLIRNTSVSELSNDVITRNITEQLYGLLTEHRARFVSDAHIGTLIVDMLYQFSAVSQTVSQLAMPMVMFSGMRGGMSGDASPAVSQFPSPQLAPESSLARGGLSLLPSLTSALSSQYESASARSSAAAAATRGRDGLDSQISAPADSLSMPISVSRAQTTGSVTGVPDLSEYRMGTAASEMSYQSGSVSSRIRPHDSASYVSSPRMMPATAHSSTASLLSLLAPVNSSGNNSVSGSFGRSVGGSTHQHHQRSRMYFPTTSTIPNSNRLSVDLADSESESSARPSLDDLQVRPSLNRHASKLSISSDAPENQTFLHKKGLRASIQPHHLFNHFARIQQQQQQQAQAPSSPQSQLSQQELRLQAKQQALAQLESGRDDAVHPTKMTRISRPATMFIPGGSRQSMFRRASESTSRHEKLAKLLNQDIDSSDSMPNSPAEPTGTPGYMSSETDPIAALSQSPSASLGPIPEIRQGSGSESQEPSIHRPSLVLDDNGSTNGKVSEADIEAVSGSKSTGSHASSRSSKLAVSPQGSITSLVLQSTHTRTEDKSPSIAQAEIPLSGMDVGNASEAEAAEESVVCRICERSFHRSALNLHSDVCMLEQTRAIKLDETNHRIKRLRDSVAKRLNDLKKARQWDRIAIRESERVIRIAERAVVWPEGDSQHELIIAKSKFAKYIEKLETITGAAATSTSPMIADDQNKATFVSSVAAASKLPRADVETIWLAKQLLARIQDKCTIIEEFDKEFSRLERQEALIRQAESAGTEAESDSEPMHATNPFQDLPTWSQLAQHTGQRSPTASERTSMDFAPSQSESGSATPDVAGSFALGIAKGSTLMGRRNSRHSRPSRRSLSRSARLTPDIADSDTPTTVSGSPVSGGSGNGSGSRKLVSLFAALFRNGGSSGFGRNKDATSGPSVLRRKNTSSAFTANVLPVMSRSSSALRRLSQNTPSSQSSASISATTTPTPVLVPATPGSSGALSTLAVPPEPGLVANNSTTATIPTPADLPLSSPVTRQRNNSQLSSMRATPESAVKVQRMPSIDEFDFIKPISRGAFGRVYLTRKKATKDLYAIKVMRKKDMINKNMVTQALAERRALSLLSTDWVVQLYYAFHSSKHLFLVMEYLVGGDLAGLLRVWGVMEEDAAKFYIAEIACAIDYLHRNSIVHRDIKPDNVILASDGHIKLTDFGLSQVAVRGNASESNTNIESPMSEGTPLSEGEALGRLAEKPEDYWDAALKQAGRSVQTPALAIANAQASKALPVSKRAHARKSTRSFLGTPDYLAPELLLGAGNGLAVDWWALGVCLFEFVCGYPPFTDQSPEAIFRNILNHAIDWPDEDGYVSEEAVELINALLHPDPTTRAHWKDIKAAKLFEGWDMSVIRQMEPPFVPQPDDDADTSYFEPCQRSEIQRLSNATFLQMDTPKKPSSTTSRQQSARATEVLPASDLPKESQQGSQRGSQRGRSTSGSTSVRNTHGTTSNVGQLKKLFSETTASEDNKDDNSQQQTVSETAENQEPSTARSIISSSSSDSYSFTNVDSKPVNVGAQSSSKTVIPFAVLPAAAAGEESDAELVLTPLRRRSSSSSINSLSEPEIEPIPTRRISSVAVSAVQLMENSGPLSPASRLPPPLPINHAKRVMGCLPILPDLNPESGSSSPSTKSHSRCASINIVLAGNKKGGVGARSRRPSDGPDNVSDSEITAPLVRSSSTDERLQNITVGGSATAMASNAGDPVSASENDSIADDNDKNENDEDPERVFEDFSYKNLALLSHVNKGVSSSSGNSVPPADKPSFASSPAELAPAPASVPTDSPTQFPAAHGSTSVDKVSE